MKKIMIGEVNRWAHDAPEEFIAECERNFADEILRAAEIIKKNKKEGKSVVLLSGPSGSGKTTSANRIVDHLKESGINSHTISMDDYFYSKDTYPVPPLDENGKLDLESPLCLDSILLSDHIERLAKGEEIHLPKFDFVAQRRSTCIRPLRLLDDEIVVIEGIHALNPDVTGMIMHLSTGVYVSMRTRFMEVSGRPVGPEHMRVIRRIVRDYTHRNRPADQTIDAWKSVRRGELLYILPYKEYAEINIDTLVPYEGCVTTPLAKPIMEKYPSDNPEASELERIIPLFVPIDRGLVPKNSLLWEFVGD